MLRLFSHGAIVDMGDLGASGGLAGFRVLGLVGVVLRLGDWCHAVLQITGCPIASAALA